MGSTISSNKKTHRRHSFNSLQGKVLLYLLSDREEGYRINPVETFSNISHHKYSSLVDFIRHIRPKRPLDFDCCKPQAKEGLRYVVKDNPDERGKLVKVVNVADNDRLPVHMAYIEMDIAPKHRNFFRFLFFKITAWFISWVFPNFGKTIRAYLMDKLELEKEYYRKVLINSNAVSEEISILGAYRGIEGSNNSCYLDSLLVSMFYRTTIFDRLLISKHGDNEYAKITRELLGTHIVKPLRSTFYCSSASAMSLRRHLRALDEDVMGSFMDVEQLLYLLLEDALKEQEFIQYSGGGGDYMHLMSIDIHDSSSAITVQINFETSLQLNGYLKLKTVPNPGLILGLPRSDGKFVNYEAVIPNVELNIQHLMEPADCGTCNRTASWEITNQDSSECSDVMILCCEDCLHCLLEVNSGNGKLINKVVSRVKMRLLAIICISASHFTAFVRDTIGSDEWVFFDSMAGGYPEVKIVDELDKWLNILAASPMEFKSYDNIPIQIERTYTDCHMCIYEPVLYKHNIQNL
ncbi:unnamed protein product [Orchesella dallaii]|uniref:Ubiquitin carboxyl-terminal hydrolase CYLD n=1 Tax=Orchesella dallaii TaxID=48710 RepID=A0ABP1QNY2_9HEXA